jgi:MFS family permease
LTLQTVAASTDPTASSLPSKSTLVDPLQQPLPFRALLTFPVLTSALNYAALSLVDIAFRAIQPLFLSTPIAMGSLGLAPSRIGAILSVFGILNGVFQVLFFARIHARWGTRNVYIAGISSALLLFALFPVINALARADPGLEGWAVWIAVFTQVVLSILISLSYGCIFLFIAGSSPNRASLGATNGMVYPLFGVTRLLR